VGFEGAQYRRVRKIAEENNRRHAQSSADCKDEERLIRGLVGMTNLLDIGRVGTKQIKGTQNAFHISTHYGTKKKKSGSMDMHFRRHLRPNDTQRGSFAAGIDQEVKCYGKQIL
jgi:hypothetical protein